MDGGLDLHMVFLSTPSARRATKPLHAWMRQWHHFYPRPPRGGRPRPRPQECHADQISIHALREEGDHTAQTEVGATINFYPRPPRGGRRFTFGGGNVTLCISIHALREEGDLIL